MAKVKSTLLGAAEFTSFGEVPYSDKRLVKIVHKKISDL